MLNLAFIYLTRVTPDRWPRSSTRMRPIWLIFYLIQLVRGTGECDDLVPNRNIRTGSQISPFQLTVSNTSYFAGVALRVIIEDVSPSERASFTGFLIQGRTLSSQDVSDQKQAQGRFYFFPKVPVGLKMVQCPNRNIQYDDGYGVTMVTTQNYRDIIDLPLTLMWLTHYYIGPVQFTATFLGRPQSSPDVHYWHNIKSSVIHENSTAKCAAGRHDCGDSICYRLSDYCPANCSHGFFRCSREADECTNPPCPSTHCVAQHKVCDGQYDCPRLYDDENKLFCGQGCDDLSYKKCPGSDRCIHRDRFCNGFNDCDRDMDEYNCRGECGGEFNLTSGVIDVPVNTGTNMYRDSVDCRWTLTALPGLHIQLTFTDVKLYVYRREFCEDVIRVYDGDRLVAKLCDETEYLRIQSTSSVIIIEFQTDVKFNHKAWRAHYLQFKRAGPNLDCRDPLHCTGGGSCTLVDGQYKCQCDHGFNASDSYNTDCIDINECALGVCQNGRCINTRGSFRCKCNYDFEPTDDGKFCKRKCYKGKRLCSDLITCVKHYGLCGDETCPSINFRCDYNELCLPQGKKCDGESHCNDRTDEIGCLTKDDCKPNQFLCSDGSQCIPITKVCDTNRYDCDDHSDERGYNDDGDRNMCSGKCNKYEYSCARSGRCIPRVLMCDGYDHCPWGDDEEDFYGKPCKESNYDCYYCSDGRCIPLHKKCDGWYDCTGGDDEDNPDCGGTSRSTIAIIVVVIIIVVVVIVCLIVYRKHQLRRKQALRGEGDRPSAPESTPAIGGLTVNLPPITETRNLAGGDNQLRGPESTVPESPEDQHLLPPSYNDVWNETQVPAERGNTPPPERGNTPPPAYHTLPQQETQPSVQYTGGSEPVVSYTTGGPVTS